ncbi:MAG: UDP-N-acetylmuramoyl-L-alanine--D-glutamate ligase [bacterium]
MSVKQRFQDSKVTVMGFGLFGGGASAARWLVEAGALVTITDLRTADDLAPALEAWNTDPPNGAPPVWVLGEHREEDFTGADWVVANPAVPPDHELLVTARGAGAKVTSEMELFLESCAARLVLITGTQGKSSTAHILERLLKHSGHSVVLGGNIGVSLLAKAADLSEDTIAVVEISSYQLEALSENAERGRAEVVAITNVLADHLERHGSVAAYERAKARILEQLGPEGTAFLPVGLIERPRYRVQADCFVRTHSRTSGDCRVVEGRFRADDENLGAVSNLALPGSFQVDNALLALGMARKLGGEPADLARSLGQIKGLEHRMESLGDFDGIVVVDNGVSTTPDSTLAALESVSEPCTLMLGGQAKEGLSWNELARQLKARGTRVVAYGASAQQIHWALLQAGAEAWVETNLEQATHHALDETPKGGTLLFSPACASFDEFQNFKDRSLAFHSYLQSYK